MAKQDEQAFAPGDLVRLKSGGPTMTVFEVAPAREGRGNVVRCGWFEGSDAKWGDVCDGGFPVAALVRR